MGARSVMAGVAVGALFPCVVLAQETPSTNPPRASSEVEEVVVTAQKRAESLQRIPGSVSAIGGEALKAQGLTSIQQIAIQAPGLDYGQHNGAAFVTLRGVGLAVDTGVAEPNVAIHVDGVFLPRTTMETLDELDLKRVEILRGPQGTLYGRNATGGAINFISEPPADKPGGEAQLLVGDYGTVEARGFVTGPIADRVRGRLSVGYADRGDGYVSNRFTGSDFDTRERLNIRGALSIDVTPTFKADVSLSYLRETFQTYQQLIYPTGPVGPLIFPPLATAISPTAPWTIGNDYNPNSHRSLLLARIGLEWALTPGVTLKSTTGYIDHKFTNRIDGDGTSAAYLVIRDREQPSQSVSQEFDLTGRFGSRGNWLLGAYLFHENFTSSIPVVLPSGLPAEQLPPETALLSAIKEDTTSYAVFGDATIDITRKFRVYGGARLARDEKDFLQSAGALIPGVPEPFTLSCQNQESSRTFDSFSPRAGVQYDVADHVMAYVQYSKGFKSGGLNSSTCGNTYAPETLQAEEVGIKSSLMNNRVVVNASYFHYDYRGLQIFKIVGLNAVIENADASYDGAEFEAHWKVDRMVSVDASATLLDATFSRLLDLDPADPAAGVQDLNGKRVPRSPPYLVSLGVQDDIPLAVGPFVRLSLRADARWSGKFYFQPFNTSAYSQGDYAIVNLNAILATGGGFSARAFVRNVSDEAVRSQVFYNSIQDGYLGNYLPPRTFGVELTQAF